MELRSSLSESSTTASVIYRISHAVAPKRKQIEEPKAKRTLKPISLTAQQRKAFRILRELRNDIQRQHGHLKLPNSWLLKEIIRSHFQETGEFSWNITIYHLLKHLHQTAHANTIFHEHDTHKPLFPTQDGYTLKEFRAFVYCCLSMIENHGINTD